MYDSNYQWIAIGPEPKRTVAGLNNMLQRSHVLRSYFDTRMRPILYIHERAQRST